MVIGDIDLILSDFRGISDLASCVLESSLGARPFSDPRHTEPMRAYDFERGLPDVLFWKPGIAWFHAAIGAEKRPYATPADYPAIRDDPAALGSFLIALLDREWVESGMSFGAIDCTEAIYLADYAVWLHKYTENEVFRSHLETQVLDLLHEELKRDFKAPDGASAEQPTLQEFHDQFI